MSKRDGFLGEDREPISEEITRKINSKSVGFFNPTGKLKYTKTPLDAKIPDAIPKTVYLDRKSDFSPIDTDRAKYVNIRNDKHRQPSPLQVLHTKDNFIDDYYAQLKNDSGLGIRKNTGPATLSLLKQPFIVRDIGNNWGLDRFNPDNIKGIDLGSTGEVLKLGMNILDQLGGAVIGRQPSVFVSRAFADYARTGAFLLSAKGIGFLAKQMILKRTNVQNVRTDVKYGITNDLDKYFIDTQKYNILSLASQPGIGSLQFSINKKSIDQVVKKLDFEELKDKLTFRTPPEIRDTFESLKRYNVEIDSKLNFTPPDLLELISPVGTLVSNFVSRGVDYLKSKLPSFQLASPFADVKVPKLKNPLGTGGDFGQGLVNGLRKASDAVGTIAQAVKDASPSLTINSERLPVDSSKHKAIDQNLKVFGEVGIDKVNLIPYGKRETAKYNEETEEQLDFIPFRFEDRKGNLIVFRALLSGITDTFTPEYASERYIGRPDNVYVYQGTTREISFTLDIYPKSAKELPILWEKMNYLAGLTYPDWTGAVGGGMGMVAPFSKLTIGQMYADMPGYLSSLTYSVQDSGTWETMFAQVPKYIQAACTFVYVGDRLPSFDQKHYDMPWLGDKKFITETVGVYNSVEEGLKTFEAGRYRQKLVDSSKLDKFQATKALSME